MPGENTDLVDRVVRTVGHQTSPTQPDSIRADKVVMILSGHGNETADGVRKALDDAVAAGKLERDEERVWIPE